MLFNKNTGPGSRFNTRFGDSTVALYPATRVWWCEWCGCGCVANIRIVRVCVGFVSKSQHRDSTTGVKDTNSETNPRGCTKRFFFRYRVVSRACLVEKPCFSQDYMPGLSVQHPVCRFHSCLVPNNTGVVVRVV